MYFLFEEGAWQDIITLPLGFRSKKPRNKGLTMVIDKGLGLKETRDLLETSGGYIDFLKLGFGTAAFYSTEMLKKKISIAKEFNVEIYPGGTFLEVAHFQKIGPIWTEPRNWVLIWLKFLMALLIWRPKKEKT